MNTKIPDGKTLLQIPFCGFYESQISQAIDSELEQAPDCESERWHEDKDSRAALPKSYLLDAFYRCANFSAAYRDCALAYARDFALRLDDLVEFKTGLAYESVEPPRDYNFTSDRLFCLMDTDAVRKLRDTVSMPALRRVAQERHTSHDGFDSFYSNDVEDWGDLETWDHNQFMTLLVAVIEDCTNDDVREFERDILNNMHEATYKAFSDNVAWQKFEEMTKAKAAELQGVKA